MIPCIAIMLAVYMCARLIRPLIGPKKPKVAGEMPTVYLPDILDFIAICVITYMAYAVYKTGEDVTVKLEKAGISTPN